jgi:hypothetical protein
MTSSDPENPAEGFTPPAADETEVAGEPATVPSPKPPLTQERKNLLIAATVIFAGVAVIVVTALFVVGRGGGIAGGSALAGQKTSAAPSGHLASNSKLASSSTPEVAATTVHLPPKLRAALQDWNRGTGGRALAAVSTDLGTALQAGGVRQYVAMRAACTSLIAAVQAARTGPPIPNGAVQQRYTIALTHVAGAAADCHAAISEHVDGDETVATHEDPALFHSAETRFGVAVKDLYSVTAELAIAGR